MKNEEKYPAQSLLLFLILHSSFFIEPCPSPFPSRGQRQAARTLARLLDRSDGFRCLSHYASAEDALKDLPRSPNVVLMDINLPGMNGVECVRKLKPLIPEPDHDAHGL